MGPSTVPGHPAFRNTSSPSRPPCWAFQIQALPPLPTFTNHGPLAGGTTLSWPQAPSAKGPHPQPYPVAQGRQDRQACPTTHAQRRARGWLNRRVSNTSTLEPNEPIFLFDVPVPIPSHRRISLSILPPSLTRPSERLTGLLKQTPFSFLIVRQSNTRATSRALRVRHSFLATPSPVHPTFY